MNFDEIEIPHLISFALCPFVQRSAILLAIKKQPFKRVDIDLLNKPEWFLKQVPTGRVPALVINDEGPKWLFESAIINEYLDEQYGPSLLSDHPLTRAQERSQIAYSESLLMLQYKALNATDAKAYQDCCTQLSEALARVEPLDDLGYFSQGRFGLVDAAFAPLVTRLEWLPEIQLTPKVARWFATLADLKEVRQSVRDDFAGRFQRFFKERNSYALLRSSC